MQQSRRSAANTHLFNSEQPGAGCVTARMLQSSCRRDRMSNLVLTAARRRAERFSRRRVVAAGTLAWLGAPGLLTAAQAARVRRSGYLGYTAVEATFGRAANDVARILGGADAADSPVQEPTRFKS